jgi:glycosyltransferase involved in cell wall biosynthesis
MKILFINKFFFHNGGSETVFFQERDFVMRQGHEVLDFSMEHPRNYDSRFAEYFVPNVDYHRDVGKGTVKSLFESVRKGFEFVHNGRALRRLEALIRKEKPDIAHLHNIYHQLTPSIIPLLRRFGVKVVLSLHDYKLLCPAYLMINNDRVCNKCKGKHFWRATFHRCAEGSYARSALLSFEAYWHKLFRSYESVDLFVSPSRFLANLLSKYRVERGKILVLRNGVEIDDGGLSEIEDEYIIYFGRVSREKGVETLLAAYDEMLREREAQSLKCQRLRIVGSGSLLAGLRVRYPRVEFLGYQSGDTLRDLVAGSSFAVVPSEWNENCSLSVLEAMRQGKPLVASRIGGVPEQVQDGECGLLFEAGDVADLKRKMISMMDDAALRRRMGRAAREKLKREYSLGDHCEALVAAYKGLLHGGAEKLSGGKVSSRSLSEGCTQC